jgi:hypothetical protein
MGKYSMEVASPSQLAKFLRDINERKLTDKK